MHAQRRALGGARQAASDQVTLRQADRLLTGWTLNVSRGGARLIVEEPVVTGQTWELLTPVPETDSDPAASQNPLSTDAPDGAAPAATTSRPIRIVWVRDEAGGQIVGVQFLDAVGTIPPFDEPSDPT